MVDWLGISIFIIAIAFAVLVVFLAIVLVGVAKSLKKVDRSLFLLEKEGGELLRQSNELLKDINKKIHDIDPFFDAAHSMGEVARRFSEKKKEEAEEPASTIAEILKWAVLGASVIQKMVSRR